MLIKKPGDIRYSEVTPQALYFDRRKFLAALPAAFLAGRELLSPSARAEGESSSRPARNAAGRAARNLRRSK